MHPVRGGREKGEPESAILSLRWSDGGRPCVCRAGAGLSPTCALIVCSEPSRAAGLLVGAVSKKLLLSFTPLG